MLMFASHAETPAAPEEPPRKLRIGLACAGGVVEGAIYEIGALRALEESIHGLDANDLHVYVGVSAGALVTSCLANGITTRQMADAIIHQTDPLLNMEPSVLFTPAVLEFAKRVAKVPGAVFDALRRFVLHPADTSLLSALSSFGHTIPAGFFSNAPLERYLSKIFEAVGISNDFRDLPTKLRIIATHVDSAEAIALGDEATAHVPISKAVQASTALPVFYTPVEIDGKHYVDGVARRTVNASVALEEDLDLLICLNPIVPVDTSALAKSLVEYGMPSILSQTFRTLVHSRMETGFKKYEHLYPATDIVLIEPDMSDYSLFFSNIFSFSTRHRVCEHAYQQTRLWMLARADALEPMLRQHGLRLDRAVLEDPERTLFAPPAVAALRRARGTLDRLDETLDRLIARAA